MNSKLPHPHKHGPADRSGLPLPFPDCRAVVLGASAGGPSTLRRILKNLQKGYPLPLILVQHLHQDDDGLLVGNLSAAMAIPVVEAVDKMPLAPGRLHVAPAGYHLFLERDRRLSLSLDAPQCWSRPSIDLLFDSAARVFSDGLLGVLLSGANEDGVDGLRAIQERGGRTLVQNPRSADFPVMPEAAVKAGVAQWVLSPGQIAAALEQVAKEVGIVQNP